MALGIEWAAETVRFSWFGNENLGSATDIWARIREDVPQDESRQAGGAISQASGPIGPGTLIIVVNPGRIDIHITPPMPNEIPGGLLNIGPLDDAFNLIRPLARNFLQKDCPATRVAFGATINSATTTRDDAFATLGRALPDFRPISPLVEDFLFQANRPREMSVGSRTIKINRLTKWQAISSKGMTSISNMGVAWATLAIQSHYVRAEIDVNTSPLIDHPFSSDEVRQLEPILSELAHEISVEGDIV